MQKIIVSLLVLVLCGTDCIYAQRRKPPKSRSRRRLPVPDNDAAIDVYQWIVGTSNGTLVPQTAIVLPDKDAVTIITRGQDLRSLDMIPSEIRMDPSTGMMVIKQAGRNSPCFLASFDATKTELQSNFSAWNDTTMAMSHSVTLNGTAPAMTRQEAASVFQDNRDIARACRTMIPTTSEIVDPAEPDTRTLQLLGYNSNVSLIVSAGGRPRGRAQRGQGGASSGRNGGGRRPGGPQGGRRSGRGRGQNRRGRGQNQGRGQGSDQGQGEADPEGFPC